MNAVQNLNLLLHSAKNESSQRTLRTRDKNAGVTIGYFLSCLYIELSLYVYVNKY
jgi:hypothetical protein